MTKLPPTPRTPSCLSSCLQLVIALGMLLLAFILFALPHTCCKAAGVPLLLIAGLFFFAKLPQGKRETL